ncbi:MAG: protein translocase subunit SecD [Candidatus Nealsonbacteria bacterium]|nr:protein translocase subunit SecD [Candidatus Nealsonbacteria bacterium]
MLKSNLYTTIVVIFILAFLAGNFCFPQFLKLGFLPDIPFKLGLDLQGGTHLVYEADMSGIEKAEQQSSIQGLRDVIERRVNLFGVREPIVQTQEAGEHYRLIVELAGVQDSAEAIKMIGETPFLEFKEQAENYDEIIEANSKAASSGAEETELQDPFISTLLTGKYLKKAEIDFDNSTYKPMVLLQFDSEGAKLFEELTFKNIGKPLAIYIDGIPISVPIVQEVISQGRAQISGSFNIEEAKTLARNLNAGALPVPINLISQQNVGPTLGEISLQKSLKAGMFGLLAVILFLIIFYRLPGLLASLALVIYVCFALALFKLISVTLTLAGIGGFILSIGMAIDANILIFSRMKEELKNGKPFAFSVEEGFKRAWPAIRDGNMTTLIVALILFGFGTSFVKGFALTLSIGIILSMFSAIIISKNFLRCFVGTKLERVKILWQ